MLKYYMLFCVLIFKENVIVVRIECILCVCLLCPGTARNCLNQSNVWLTVALTALLCVLPVVAYRFFCSQFYPTINDKVSYFTLQHIIDLQHTVTHTSIYLQNYSELHYYSMYIIITFLANVSLIGIFWIFNNWLCLHAHQIPFKIYIQVGAIFWIWCFYMYRHHNIPVYKFVASLLVYKCMFPCPVLFLKRFEMLPLQYAHLLVLSLLVPW